MDICDISIIVPSLNEQDTLEELFHRTKKTIQNLGLEFEIIFIDDGSTDRTPEILNKLQKQYSQVGIISHAKNYGKSIALMEGMDMAQGKIIVTLDADLQEDPEDIPLLLNKLSEGYDMVSGHRHKRQDSKPRLFVSKVYNWIVSAMLRTEFKDINCGFKAFTSEVKSRLNLRSGMHRLLPAIATSFGFNFAEVEISHHPRAHGTSRFHLLRHRGILDLLLFMVQQMTQQRPFHIMSEVGIILVFFSFILLLTTFILVNIHLDASLLGMIFVYLLGIFAAWIGLVGTLLPALGFIIETHTTEWQDKQWRKSLAKQHFPPFWRQN